MPAPRKYPPELRERAQRLVAEAMVECAEDDLAWVRKAGGEDVQRPPHERQSLACSRPGDKEDGSLGGDDRFTLRVVEVLDDRTVWTCRRARRITEEHHRIDLGW